MLRQDTVVSLLPEFDDGESTRVDTGTANNVRVGRAVSTLDNGPQLSSAWGSSEPALRVVDGQQTRPRARRPSQPQPSQRQAARPQPPRRQRRPSAPSTVQVEDQREPTMSMRGRPGLSPVPAPPTPPAQPARRGPAGKSIMPLPEACFEPSVVATMPVTPARTPEHTPLPTTDATPALQGKLIAMFSCRGGAGSTTLAVNTAADLIRAGHKVCLVDLDLQLGDVFVALDLDSQTSLAALAREASTIDEAALLRRMARHDSGLYAISQTGNLDDLDAELVERLPALFVKLCEHFDYVIVDGIRDFGDNALAALDMADQIAMVLTQDVAAVRRAARAVTLFRRLGYSDSKLQIILNRTTRKAKVGSVDILRALGLPVAAEIRNSYKRMHAAFNDGALIGDVARTSGVAKDITKLSKHLTRSTAAARQSTAPVIKQKKSLLSFLRRSKETN